jgi:hypothetical protein
MKIDATEFVKTVGLDSLKTIVANWHGDGALELLEWQAQPLTGGSIAAGIYRVSGTAQDRRMVPGAEVYSGTRFAARAYPG